MKLIKRLLERFFGETSALPELKKQSKICYPGYKDCEYDSLRDAVQHFRKKGFNMEYCFPDIIKYNVCYRDYLRDYGFRVYRNGMTRRERLCRDMISSATISRIR